MFNVVQENPLLAGSVLVAVSSLVLQYLSHRSTALDSVYDREEKIDAKIEKLGELFTDRFTIDGYTLKIEFIKSTVTEHSSVPYRVSKYLNPFSDIHGTTKLGFKLTEDVTLEPGDYEVVGDFEGRHLDELALRVMPNTASLLFVTVDSVEISDVADALTEIDTVENLEVEENAGLID